MSDWHFDPISAVIGALLSLALSWTVYRRRQSIAALRDRIVSAVRTLIGKITATVEQRYRERVLSWAPKVGLLSHTAPLDRTFVLPPLLSNLPYPDPDAHEPGARTPLSWEAALGGYNRLLIAGELGSGRTSLLAHLAFLYARQKPDPELSVPLKRLPLYLHLSKLDCGLPGEEEKAPAAESEKKKPSKDEPSPEDRLIKCALNSVDAPAPYGTALQASLKEGNALVLIDGWDTLPDDKRAETVAWLAHLADTLPNNLWIVAAEARGFAPLTDVGFVPLILDRWAPRHARALVSRWTDARPPAPNEHAPNTTPLSTAVNAALQQGATPLELALRCWLFFDQKRIPQGRAEVFETSLAILLAPPPGDKEKAPDWTMEMTRDALATVALAMYEAQRDTFTRQEWVEALDPLLPVGDERPARIEDRMLESLTRPGGLLTAAGPETYRFVHRVWQAYLAAHYIATLPPEALLKHLEDPFWAPVVAFYAALAPMEPIIKAWLSKPDDLWFGRLRRTAQWAASAPPSAKWRNGVMALLARKLLTPGLLPTIRHRVADALIETGDPGVVYFLRQAAGHADSAVRISALEALGNLAGEADLPTLEVALSDNDLSVQQAAVNALRMMRNRAAVHRLTRLLVEAEQELRIHAARALADCGEEGWEVIQEALEEEDILIRRAAVFGLGDIKQPWAREKLAHVIHNDSEWIVRSAAETALEQKETAAAHTVEQPLDASDAGWLIVWAASRHESVGKGDAALKTLAAAIESGTPPIRRAAIEALGIAGRPEHVSVMHKALHDEDATVALAAFNALEELARRHDVTIRA
ncbi:MAG: HEAT repeat domain-containing protein [Anaerolineae bacterium]|nr:HEAT repeat domain-containing protein [Anaerolineae bacterium]